MRVPSVALLVICLLSSPLPVRAEESPQDCALDSLTCTPAQDGYEAEVEVEVPGSSPEPVVVEVVDAAGGVHRQTLSGSGRQVLKFKLPAPASEATVDPQERLVDPDRYNNHLPRRVVVTPWPAAPTDAYLLRYFPGLTFKQGLAPVRPKGAPMMPPAQGPMGLGIGLEGRLRGEHGWQVLANMGSSPFAPSLTPRFSLHGYWLPHPNWGLDGDVGFDWNGNLTSEVGTSMILWDGPGPASASPVLAHQLRAAVGHQTLMQHGPTGYDYGQLTLFRDDTATIGLASNASVFMGLDGGWRATMDGQRADRLTDWLSVRLNGSVGTSNPQLPQADRIGSGLYSQDWVTARHRVYGRISVLTPLARGLGIPLGPVATLAQVEGNLFVEGAQLWNADVTGREGLSSGVGVELVLLNDTVMGFPLAINVGYALPVTNGAGFTSPFPGRFYLSTTDAFFPRLPAPSPSP